MAGETTTSDPEAARQRDPTPSWLAAQAIAGDEHAFETLVLGHGGYWYALAVSKLGDSHLAQDAVQEALLLAWRQRATLRNPEVFTSWMSTIVLRTCSSLKRRHQRKQMAPLENVPEQPEVHPREAALDESNAERKQALAEAIDTLEDEDQCVLAMRYGMKLSYREIAERLKITEAAVRGRLHRVRDQLRGQVRRAEA